MFQAFDASSSGLNAQRMRMNIIANNLANVHTTRNEFGEKVPFRRRLAIFADGNENNSDPRLGVSVLKVVDDNADFRLVYDPNSSEALRMNELYESDEAGVPDFSKRKESYADMPDDEFEKMVKRVGYVQYPNINPDVELVDAMMAARSYEANISAIEISKSMISESLSIIA